MAFKRVIRNFHLPLSANKCKNKRWDYAAICVKYEEFGLVRCRNWNFDVWKFLLFYRFNL